MNTTVDRRAVFVSLLITALVTFAIIKTGHQKVGCEFKQGGAGYTTVEQGGTLWTYTVGASGPIWSTGSYGYHATGALVCDGCKDAPGAFGLYHLIPLRTSPENEEFGHPRNSKERVAQASEIFGYPWSIFEGNDLSAYEVTDEIQVGPLMGYAVVFRLAPDAIHEELSKNAASDLIERGALIALSLWDDCILFDATVLTLVPEHSDAQMSIDTLLTELEIAKMKPNEKTFSPRLHK